MKRKSMKKLSLEYICSKGVNFADACLLLECISSCAIENPRCKDDETIDTIIKNHLLEKEAEKKLRVKEVKG